MSLSIEFVQLCSYIIVDAEGKARIVKSSINRLTTASLPVDSYFTHAVARP